MKTLKFLGTAMMAVCMGCCFSACGDDDDKDITGGEGEGDDGYEEALPSVPQEPKGRLLTCVECYENGELSTKDTYIYNDKRQLIKTIQMEVTPQGNYTDEYNYTWSDNHISCTTADLDEQTEYTLENDTISFSSMKNSSEARDFVYKYDDRGQLIGFGEPNKPDDERIWRDMTWTYETIDQVVMEYPGYDRDGKMNISKSKSNEGYCPYLYYRISLEPQIHMPAPELFGKVTDERPSKMTLFNNDGTVEIAHLTHTITDGYITVTEVHYTAQDEHGHYVDEKDRYETWKYYWEQPSNKK